MFSSNCDANDGMSMTHTPLTHTPLTHTPLTHTPLTHTPLTHTPLTHTRDVERGCEEQHRVRDYRKLAICSIICGLSCLGIMSLIYSVKTREHNKRSGSETSQKAREYSRKTVVWAVGAMLAWFSLLILTVLLMGLASFLLTFID